MFKIRNILFMLFAFSSFHGLSIASTLTSIKVNNNTVGSVVHMFIGPDIKYSVFDLESIGKVIIKFKDSELGEDLSKNGRLYLKDINNKNSAIKDINFGFVNKDLKLSFDYKDGYSYEVVKTHHGINIIFKKNYSNTALDNNIRSIEVKDFSSYSEITIHGNNIENSKKRMFLLNNGTSFVVDIIADNIMSMPSLNYPSSRVKSVVVNELKKKVRLTFDLVNRLDKGYRVSYGRDAIKIKIGNGKSTSDNLKITNIYSVLFSAKKEVEYIDITFGGSEPQVLFKNDKKSVSISIKNARISSNQEGNFDVSEFFGVIKDFVVHNDIKSGSVIISANLTEAGKFSIVQLPKSIRIVIEPEAIAISRGSNVHSTDMFKYSGDHVDLNYDNASIKNVLKTIAEISGVNFVISDTVKGNITIKLKGVPWDQALDLILRSKSLGKEKEGNIIRIAPMEDLMKEYSERVSTLRSSKGLEPVVTEFVHLKYKKTTDIKDMFDNMVTSSRSATSSVTQDTAGSEATLSEGNKDNGIISSRGSILFDNEKNVIIIKDTVLYVNNFKRIISEIDTAPKQVLIEARIVEATDSFSRDLGVSWGGSFNKISKGGKRGLSIGGGNGTTANNFGITNNQNRGKLVDLPAAVGLGSGGVIGMSIGTIAGNVVDLELSAAEGDGEIKIVSKPRVLVIDGKQANINQGTDIPFQSSSQNTGTKVEFKKANLGLIVTPFVKGDGEIVMHVLVTKDSPGNALVGQNPIISTKQVETYIFVKDGETVVIGGIYTTNNEHIENKVPLLGDLPILGHLFKHSKTIKNRTELLVFITPKIMNND